MRTIFSLGPIETEDGHRNHLCFVFSPDRGVDSESAPTALAALRKLQSKGSTRGAVCEPELAAEAAELGLQTTPLPEDLLEMKAGLAVMLDHGGNLGDARTAPLLTELIEVAAEFEEAAPWDELPSNLTIDLQVKGIPAAGRPCEATVMGHGGAEFGVALFYSRGTAEEVERLTRSGRGEEARAFQTLLCFLDEAPEFVTRAVDAFTGLPIAPHVLYLRRGQPGPASSEDLAVLVGAMDAIVQLGDGAEVGTGRVAQYPRLEVVARLRAQGAEPLAAVETALPKVGRNDPCPCGSGKKFKRCCAGAGQAPAASATKPATSEPGVSPWHEVDRSLQQKTLAHAVKVFGPESMKGAAKALHGDCEPSLELLIPWSCYEYQVDGTRSAGAALLADEGAKLDQKERLLLEAQLASKVSVFEVLEARRGEGLRLHDLFSGESFFVRERSASLTLGWRDVVVARVVHVGEELILAGVHRSPLPPEKAEPVLEKLGGAVNFGLPPRPAPAADVLVHRWDDAVSAHALELASPAVMTNTDGEPVLFVEQSFALKKGARDELVDRLVGLEHVTIDKDTASSVELTFARPGNALHASWKSTVLGSVKVTKASLVLTTNSEQRASALRSRIEGVAGHLLTFKKRKDTKPPEVRGGQQVSFDVQPVTVAANADAESIRATFVQRWVDEPLPELGGRTAREAVKDPSSSWKVHRLLCGLEYHAAQANEDVEELAVMRKELGLDELGRPLPNHDVELALGLGRKISACLLEVAEPLMATLEKVTAAKAEKVMELAVGLWNAAVLDAMENKGELTRMRGRLIRGQVDPAAFDAAVEIRQRRHAHDLRMVGNWVVKPQSGGYMFFAEARVDQELMDRARAAGIKPPTPPAFPAG